MATIAECLPDTIRITMREMSSGPYLGAPKNEAECVYWMRLMREEVARLRSEYDWGLQHGHAATEGYHAWFAERYEASMAAWRRHRELAHWRWERAGADHTGWRGFARGLGARGAARVG